MQNPHGRPAPGGPEIQLCFQAPHVVPESLPRQEAQVCKIQPFPASCCQREHPCIPTPVPQHPPTLTHFLSRGLCFLFPCSQRETTLQPRRRSVLPSTGLDFLFMKRLRRTSTSNCFSFRPGEYPQSKESQPFQFLLTIAEKRKSKEQDTGLTALKKIILPHVPSQNKASERMLYPQLQKTHPQQKHPHHLPTGGVPGPHCMWTMRFPLSPNHCPSSPFMLGGVQSTASLWHKRNLPAQRTGRTCSPKNGGPLSGLLFCNTENIQ